MRIVRLDEIQSVVSAVDAIAAVREGFVARANGEVELPEPMQFLFKNKEGGLTGDCHVKAAKAEAWPYFAVKVASGFYANPERGLPVNSGLVLVFSSSTGRPVMLLQDDGWLTELRTAAAGALAAALWNPAPDATLGILGTGAQGKLQAQTTASHLGISSILVHGRSPSSVEAFVAALNGSGLAIRAADSVQELCAGADVVITTTPAMSPVIVPNDLTRKPHIVAVGTDSPGKCEIDPSVLAMADLIVTDDHAQCLHHGDFGNAVRAGAVEADCDVSLCDLLAGRRSDINPAAVDFGVVDLTGLGVQDLAMANLVVERLSEQV